MPIIKCTNVMNKQILKEETQMINTHFKMLFNILSNHGNANLITLRFYLTVVRMVIVEIDNTNAGEDVRNEETLYIAGGI